MIGNHIGFVVTLSGIGQQSMPSNQRKSPKSIAKWLLAFSRPLKLFNVFTLGSDLSGSFWMLFYVPIDSYDYVSSGFPSLEHCLRIY